MTLLPGAAAPGTPRLHSDYIVETFTAGMLILKSQHINVN